MTADRLNNIAPFRVMELMERAKALESEGQEVVHFEVGEPDFPTAQPIVDAGHAALDAGRTKYTQALGIPELRERISRYYAEVVGVEVPAERIVVTSGASAGLLLLCGLLLNPQDELLMTDPGYPCNRVFVGLVNGSAGQFPLSAADGFQPDPAVLAECWSSRTRGVLLASPANPTGAVIPARNLRLLIEVARARGGFVLLDEIYQGLIYQSEPEYRSGLQLDQELYVLNSFSKYFGMTGWRLGWMVVPDAALSGITRLAQNLFISPPSIAQYAALAAFEPAAMEIHESRRAHFGRRRDQLYRGLKALGFSIALLPEGAFYLYVDISHTGMDAEDFCWKLINEFQVAVTPGIDFGDCEPARYVRFAYTTADEQIELGLQRIEKALTAWGIGC